MDDKVIVLITGANTGLGYEIAKVLLARARSYHILMGCRGDISRAHVAIRALMQHSSATASNIEPIAVDVSSDESIAAAQKTIKQQFGRLDILVNNAGVDLDTAVSSGRLSKREGWNQAWDVNVTGTHLFTEALAPLLIASKSSEPRLVFMTSGLASVAEHAGGKSSHYEIPAAGWPKPDPASYFLSYKATKTGLNMVATDWARSLRNDHIKVFLISPGFLKTGLGDDRLSGHGKDKEALGAVDTVIGAEFCVDVIEGKRDAQSWPPQALRRTMVQPW